MTLKPEGRWNGLHPALTLAYFRSQCIWKCLDLRPQPEPSKAQGKLNAPTVLLGTGNSFPFVPTPPAVFVGSGNIASLCRSISILDRPRGPHLPLTQLPTSRASPPVTSSDGLTSKLAAKGGEEAQLTGPCPCPG
ncbi:uncharacterized protein LOC111543974 [Piliocolobus tephrosceles]|uniref:uncharacterized protein LOC111543974 n=1 Tax=Piliocolobus tephrosceles TaxID=591936 RepID=UPI000C29FEFC|nr:uncharacterized protein LOC111543974 [Piliocolobus tephrosceles]